VNRARGWHHAEQRTVCDVLTPWAQGTILRATRSICEGRPTVG